GRHSWNNAPDDSIFAQPQSDGIGPRDKFSLAFRFLKILRRLGGVLEAVTAPFDDAQWKRTLRNIDPLVNKRLPIVVGQFLENIDHVRALIRRNLFGALRAHEFFTEVIQG